MENINNTAQQNLEKRIDLANKIKDKQKQIKDVKDSMASSDTEPSAKIEDARRIAVLEADLNKLIAEHDSL